MERALAKRAELDQQVEGSDKHLDTLMAKDLANEEALADATRRLAAGGLKPELPRESVHLSSLSKESAEELSPDSSVEVDLSGPVFMTGTEPFLFTEFHRFPA